MSTLTVPRLASRLSISSSCPLCGSDSASPFLQAPDRFHGRKELYRLVRCPACDLVRLDHPPEPGQMPFHYGHGYHKSIETAGEAELARRWKQQRKTILGLKRGGTLLDIGCSSGAFLRTFDRDAWQLYGVEISEEQAERTKISTGADVFVGDPLSAPYPPESFDVITCFHLLEHVYQPIELLKRVRHWLKPDGIFYVILPNSDSWEARLFRSYWYGLELPRHLFHFSPVTLERATRTAQMRTIRLRTRVEDSFSEHSFHYLFEELLGRFGISYPCLAEGYRASFPLKAIRKAFRLSIEALFRYAAAANTRGASIEGVFGRDLS